MVTSYAIIIDNKVINRILADTEFVEAYCLAIGASYSTFEGAKVGAERDADGNWILPNPVPHEATRYQAKAALHQAGLLAQVESLMSDPATDPLKSFEWTEKQNFSRNSPTLNWAAQQLGLTDAQVDDLFRAAASIEA